MTFALHIFIFPDHVHALFFAFLLPYFHFAVSCLFRLLEDTYCFAFNIDVAFAFLMEPHLRVE